MDVGKIQIISHELETLRRQYCQLIEPSQLRFPDSKALKAPDVQTWIFDHFFKSDNFTFPPPERYQLRVLKLLVSKIESAINDPEEDEISDDLMSTLSTLLSSSLLSESASAQQKTFVTYSFGIPASNGKPPEAISVTLHESRSVISAAGTTGLRTWEAALLLGSFLVSNKGRQMLHGRRVLEIGAGTGMLSILCAKHLGVSAIVATDGDEAVVDAIKTNAFLNGLDGNHPSQKVVETAALKWGRRINASTFAEDYGMEVPDVLLGADVTYDQTVIPALVATLREFFDVNPALRALIAATIRNERTFETFLNACRRNGFSLELLEVPLVPEPYQDGPFYPTSTPIKIWQITRAQPPTDPFSF